jgi:hypothetical protein
VLIVTENASAAIHRTSLICFNARPLFFAMSSSSLEVESLSLPGNNINTIQAAIHKLIVPVLCKELRLEVLPGLLAFVDGRLMSNAEAGGQMV